MLIKDNKYDIIIKVLLENYMLILVGPSASGKTEVANIIIKKYGMKKFVTCTTRELRVGEVQDVSYHFMSRDEFLELKDKNEFVETVEYNGNFYGTLKREVADDKIVILEPAGFQAFYREMKDEIVSFYLNTSEAERINRMIYRKDKDEDIKKRIENDRIVFHDIKNVDFTIVNENITLVDLADQIYNLYIKKIKGDIL